MDPKELEPGSALESKEAYRARVSHLIGDQIERASEKSARGLEILQAEEPERMDRIVSGIRSGLEVEDLVRVVTACSDEDFDALLEAGLAKLHENRLDEAEAVFVFLMCLRPLLPQVYVGLMSVLWKREGPAAAADGYGKLLPVLQSPAFNYFAADCMANAGRKDDAMDLLRKALELFGDATLEHEQDIELRKDIQEFIGELEAGQGAA